jgi:hypothetical protein
MFLVAHKATSYKEWFGGGYVRQSQQGKYRRNFW